MFAEFFFFLRIPCIIDCLIIKEIRKKKRILIANMLSYLVKYLQLHDM